jgi:hypothetical protein
MQNIDEIQLATAPSRRTITYGDYRPGSDKAHVSLAEPPLGRSPQGAPGKEKCGNKLESQANCGEDVGNHLYHFFIVELTQIAKMHIARAPGIQQARS